jgi:hypothetical protein
MMMLNRIFKLLKITIAIPLFILLTPYLIIGVMAEGLIYIFNGKDYNGRIALYLHNKIRDIVENNIF